MATDKQLADLKEKLRIKKRKVVTQSVEK